ncbi:MAG: hypothetical protein Q7V43_28765, partial [Myxococcales bacterium]|nr:hypothetical protein [Myxococcales bacterium]
MIRDFLTDAATRSGLMLATGGQASSTERGGVAAVGLAVAAAALAAAALGRAVPLAAVTAKAEGRQG